MMAGILGQATGTGGASLVEVAAFMGWALRGAGDVDALHNPFKLVLGIGEIPYCRSPKFPMSQGPWAGVRQGYLTTFCTTSTSSRSATARCPTYFRPLTVQRT